MSVELAKGTRNILPEEAFLREEILAVIRQAFERYGFKPLETPILQRFETLAAKYAGGAEILKETFKLKDQGQRELALRYDLTVPLAIFMAMNPTMKLPLKRYEIGKVFRDGPIKRGRMREFWQCDADSVGSSSILADAECVLLAQDVFSALGMKVKIRVNNIKVLRALMQKAGVEGALMDAAILALDKVEKFGKEAVMKELKEKGVSDDAIKNIFEYGSVKDLKKVRALIPEERGVDELEELFKYIEAEFDVTLARGLSYYTGTIFEVFLEKSEITSSVASGGRYDRMIGKYLGSNQVFPAVGFAFGLEPITEALKEKRKSVKKTNAEVFVIPIQTQKESLVLAQELRKSGINTELDLMGRGISKNLEYANTFGIPFVVFLGSEELQRKKYKLRDMQSGKELLVTLKDLITKVQHARKVSA